MPIEQISPALASIVSQDQPIEELAAGFGNDNGPAEGPLWWKEGGYLLFSDIGNNRRMKWELGSGATVFQEPTTFANGLTRDVQGRLIACDRTPRVVRTEPDGSLTVVANNYQSKRLNRPNDVVVKSDGSIYFTDPGAPAPGMALDFAGVYQVSADLGTLTLLVRDFVLPNGLAFSPDESILYINDSRRGHIRAFDMQPNGTLALATDRVFCDLTGERPGVPDGMKVDVEGNVYWGVQVDCGYWTPQATTWGPSSTAPRPRPILPLVVRIGKRCFSQRATRWVGFGPTFLECRSRRRPRVPLGEPGRFMTSRVMGNSAKI